MTFHGVFTAAALLTCASALAAASPARAELVLSQLVVDLEAGDRARQDIEVWNKGRAVTYVAVDPREIVAAGTARESGRVEPDPEKLGLLVSPSRMVLEPGQRKLLRVAAIDSGLDRERVYRVTVKPVVGQLSSDQSGLKVLIGYDLLVLARPAILKTNISGTRSGSFLILRNNGNSSVELTDGKQCDEAGKACDPLPGGRLYAGAEKIVPITRHGRARYVVKLPGKLIPQEF